MSTIIYILIALLFAFASATSASHSVKSLSHETSGGVGLFRAPAASIRRVIASRNSRRRDEEEDLIASSQDFTIIRTSTKVDSRVVDTVTSTVW